MARDIHAYREVAVQLVHDARSGCLCIRPIAGQAFAPSLAVHCGRILREDFPLGTCFMLQAKMSDRLGGAPFLYAWHGDAVQVLSPAAVKAFLAEFKRGRL